MDGWAGWRRRFKDWKQRNKIADADLAEQLGVSRQAVNHWLTGRNEPNLSDFFDLCGAVGADPGMILFGQPALRGELRQDSSAYRVLSASKPAEDKKRLEKIRRFKSRRRARRIVRLA